MVINILKDGTVLQDLTDHVVRQEDVPEVYQIIERMEGEEE